MSSKHWIATGSRVTITAVEHPDGRYGKVGDSGILVAKTGEKTLKNQYKVEIDEGKGTWWVTDISLEATTPAKAAKSTPSPMAEVNDKVRLTRVQDGCGKVGDIGTVTKVYSRGYTWKYKVRLDNGCEWSVYDAELFSKAPTAKPLLKEGDRARVLQADSCGRFGKVGDLGKITRVNSAGDMYKYHIQLDGHTDIYGIQEAEFVPTIKTPTTPSVSHDTKLKAGDRAILTSVQDGFGNVGDIVKIVEVHPAHAAFGFAVKCEKTGREFNAFNAEPYTVSEARPVPTEPKGVLKVGDRVVATAVAGGCGEVGDRGVISHVHDSDSKYSYTYDIKFDNGSHWSVYDAELESAYNEKLESAKAIAAKLSEVSRTPKFNVGDMVELTKVETGFGNVGDICTITEIIKPDDYLYKAPHSYRFRVRPTSGSSFLVHDVKAYVPAKTGLEEMIEKVRARTEEKSSPYTEAAAEYDRLLKLSKTTREPIMSSAQRSDVERAAAYGSKRDRVDAFVHSWPASEYVSTKIYGSIVDVSGGMVESIPSEPVRRSSVVTTKKSKLPVPQKPIR